MKTFIKEVSGSEYLELCEQSKSGQIHIEQVKQRKPSGWIVTYHIKEQSELFSKMP